MALGPTQEAAFGVETMVGYVKTFDTSAYDSSFVDVFRSSFQPPNEGGESVSWDEIRFDRDLAPVTGADSPSIPVKDMDRTKKHASLASIKLSVDISGRKLYRERNPGSLLPNAEAVLAAEVQNLVIRARKTINYMCANMLLGTLDLNPTTIPGSKITVPTITVGVNTYTKSASWSDPTTKINTVEIPALAKSFIAACGMPPGFAIINDKTETYLKGNAELISWLKYQYGMQAVASSPFEKAVFGGISVGGLEWQKDAYGYVPVSSDGTYDPANFTKYMPDDVAIVLPPKPELGRILALCENKALIPQTAIGANTPNGIIAEAPQPGIAVWAEVITSPVGVRLHLVWEGLPIVKFPKGITKATVN